MRLKDKVAIVTGGASGIGRAICELFAEEGASVAIADIDVEGGQETMRRIQAAGGEATFLKTDVSVEADVEGMVRATVRAFGTVSVLVNDAAAFVFGQVEEVTAADWEKVMGVNVFGAGYGAKHVLPVMKDSGGGSIVNIASVSSFIAQPAFVPYNTSKGALLQLTRCMALDMAPHKVRVNCVCPGYVRTEGAQKHMDAFGIDPAEFERDGAAVSFQKRIAMPREIAYGALFLASDEASFVTGTSLVMDGGWSAA
jgi:NAD(P)-dependent dehydrogenase (short-subunit alcohol dehydrogenase family)